MTDTEFGYGCVLFVIGIAVGFANISYHTPFNIAIGGAVLILTGIIGGLLLEEMID